LSVLKRSGSLWEKKRPALGVEGKKPGAPRPALGKEGFPRERRPGKAWSTLSWQGEGMYGRGKMYYCVILQGKAFYGHGRGNADEHFLVFFDLADLRSAREALETDHPDPVQLFRRVLGGIVRLSRQQAEALRAKHPGVWVDDEAHRAYGPAEPVVVHSILYRLTSGKIEEVKLLCISGSGNFQVPLSPEITE
jgi:hypothetical protein